jgi:hypothetical protein
VVTDVYDWLEERVAACVKRRASRGRRSWSIRAWASASRWQDNLAIMNRLALYQGLGLAAAAGRQPQADDRRAVERGSGGPSARPGR